MLFRPMSPSNFGKEAVRDANPVQTRALCGSQPAKGNLIVAAWFEMPV